MTITQPAHATEIRARYRLQEQILTRFDFGPCPDGGPMPREKYSRAIYAWRVNVSAAVDFYGSEAGRAAWALADERLDADLFDAWEEVRRRRNLRSYSIVRDQTKPSEALVKAYGARVKAAGGGWPVRPAEPASLS
ncbi:hypothetical protein SAMN05216368_10925 [Cryobacterium flavum]|uniref:Uncharacterized protein n=1 Tax=Cryobacterium flavum TaxID=1424659 RepID=A0A4R8V1K0_9MICO|nr:hypothetical protein [Cryobacterium flavum]TFB76097.1 hypothetical protein E3O21_11625 [Cryobacterium flavum]SDO00614.1 hypothetical protein SAMN05216368_10925 [Cryobacterium flavum]